MRPSHPISQPGHEAGGLRLFIALDLPAEVKQEIARIQARLMATRDASVRWTVPEGIHLTLKFLGQTGRDQVLQIVSALQAACEQVPAFSLRLGDPGFFPNARSPRVVWIGLQGDLDVLQRLQQAVERIIAPLGFPTEARGFSPHLTLGRTRDGAAPGQVARVVRAVQALPATQRLDFSAEAVFLMQSTLLRSGAQYTRLVEVPLGRSASISSPVPAETPQAKSGEGDAP